MIKKLLRLLQGVIVVFVSLHLYNAHDYGRLFSICTLLLIMLIIFPVSSLYASNNINSDFIRKNYSLMIGFSGLITKDFLIPFNKYFII